MIVTRLTIDVDERCQGQLKCDVALITQQLMCPCYRVYHQVEFIGEIGQVTLCVDTRQPLLEAEFSASRINEAVEQDLIQLIVSTSCCPMLH